MRIPGPAAMWLRLHTGQRVTVNGTTGTVTVHDRSG
jgi:hypothetical protein